MYATTRKAEHRIALDEQIKTHPLLQYLLGGNDSNAQRTTARHGISSPGMPRYIEYSALGEGRRK